jgi:hypothetical protein
MVHGWDFEAFEASANWQDCCFPSTQVTDTSNWGYVQ